jgi:ATP-dependent RNA helicase RhlE
VRDVRRISSMVNKTRQTLLFSATMPSDIAKLANEILKNPEKVEIAPQGRTVEKVDQRVYFVNSATKRALLSHLLSDAALERVIVFTRTKRGANRVAEALEDQGVPSEAIHGNKSQNARQKALDNFSRGKARVLVATDLASRGIDVSGVTHVINFELPADAESYVHRIGRTARAGASGIALSFCDGSERGQLKSIERLTNQRIAVVPTPSNEDMPAAPPMRPRAEREAHDSGENEARNGRFRTGGGGRPGGHGGRRKFGDRPVHDRTGHDQTRGDRPPQAAAEFRGGDFREQRPQGERPQGDRPHGDRPQGERPRGYAPRPHGDRPRGDRPHSDRPHGDRPQGDRPRSDRPYLARPQSDRPHGDRPQGDRPQGDRPQGDRPQAPRPAWKGRKFGGAGRGRGRAA